MAAIASRAALVAHPGVELVRFVLFDDETRAVYAAALAIA